MGVDTSQALETTRAQSEPVEIGDQDTVPAADNDARDLPLSRQQECNLPLDVGRDGGDAAGQFPGYDLVCRNPPPVKGLESFDLTGLQTAGLSVNFVYG
jgi:hypothetical protein